MGVISNNLASKEYKQAYLLYGSESYLRSFYKNAIKAACVNPSDNLNYSYFEGAGTDPNEVAGLLSTMPFLADYRVIVVENTGWMSKVNGSEDSAEDKKDSGGKLSTLIDAIKDIPENVIFVLSEEKADKRSKLYKAMQQKGIVEEFPEQNEDTLAKWLFNKAKAEGKRMDANTAYYMVSECGKDMYLLDNELCKLISYTLNRDVITVNDIETVCTHQIEGKIFDMISAIAMHKQKEALALYYDLLALRESPFHILTLLVRQYTQMLEVKDGMLKNVPAASLSAKLSMQEWLVKKVADQVRRMNIKDIRKNLEACAKADEDIKNGNLTDNLSVELLIISCSM